MYEVGSIIIVYNQIFNKGHGTEIDHVKKRPALVICEGEEFLYYVTLTSQPGKGHINIYANDKNQYVEMRHIYKKPVCGYIEVERIDDEDLLKVLEGVYAYHKSHQTNDFKETEKLLLYEIEKLTKKFGGSSNKK